MSTGESPLAASEQVTDQKPATTEAAAPEAVQPEERIPLPPVPPRPRPSPDRLVRQLRVLEGIVAVLLVVFAFEVGAFRAVNSDVFLHLAAGRLASQGQIAPAADPFCFAAERPWVNHSWLADLIAYQIYNNLPEGGAVLVGLKAALIVVLAFLMVRTACQPGRRRWLPLVCVLLALLAMSPHLSLRPAILSFVLLGLTLFLLTRQGPRAVWLLPVVCLLWVNLDAWFLLGPLTIALYLAGALLQKVAGEPAGGPLPVSPTRLVVVLAVSLLACLVNPAHIGAFLLPLPFDFSEASSVLAREAQFRGLFLSPLESIYFQKTVGLSAAGLSVFLLLLLGLVSFVLNVPRLCWWRVLVWLVFAALAMWSVRLIPFFAVVAGPITALNFLDASARLFGAEVRTDLAWRQWAVAGRFLTVLAGLALVVLAVPGWLQAMPHNTRQVGLGIRVDEGLRDGALRVKEWRTDGQLPEAMHWFNTSPDVTAYFAFFCPGEKTFLDQRLPQYPRDVARDFEIVTGALQGRDLPEEDTQQQRRPPTWRRVFPFRHTRFVVFHTVELSRQAATLHRLYSNPDEFTPCYLGGTTAIFAWHDPDRPSRDRLERRLAMHFDEEAFGPRAQTAPDTAPPPPGSKPWWSDVLPSVPASTVDRGTALQHVTRFQALRARYATRYQRDFRASMAAALVGAAVGPRGPLLGGGLLPLRMNYTYTALDGRRLVKPGVMDQRAIDALNRYLLSQNAGPPSSLYLAVRAARRALHELPDDPQTYLALADSFNLLTTLTRERSLANNQALLHVELIRRSQMAAALQTVLKLDPPPELAQAAHQLLRNVVYRPLVMRDWYFELRVKHYREWVKLAREQRHLPGVSDNDFDKAMEKVEAALKKDEQVLKTQRNKYEVNSANKPMLEKATRALQNGLAETAMTVLQKAKVDDLDRMDPKTRLATGQLALELLLGTGQLQEAAEVLMPKTDSDKPAEKPSFGTYLPVQAPAYEWFEAQLAAASGDYATADRALGECIKQVSRLDLAIWEMLTQSDIVPRGYGKGKEVDLGTLAGLLVGNLILQGARDSNLPWQPQNFLMRKLLPPHLPRVPSWQANLHHWDTVTGMMMQPHADLWAVRAWLSLEAGHTTRAREQAHKALELGGHWKGMYRQIRYPSHMLAVLVLMLTEPEPKK
jgi:hypothetical protein